MLDDFARLADPLEGVETLPPVLPRVVIVVLPPEVQRGGLPARGPPPDRLAFGLRSGRGLLGCRFRRLLSHYVLRYTL